MITRERLTTLAATAARRYARRCWWADVNDLRQTAELAGLEALRTYDPRVGAAPEQYVWRAMVFAVARALWRDSTPATGGTKHRPDKTAHGLVRGGFSSQFEQRDGTRTVDDEDGGGVRIEEAAKRAGLGWFAPRPDEQLEDAVWLRRVRERLTALAEEEAVGGGVLRVLLEDATARTVAEERGISTASVFAQTRRLRAAVQNDCALYTLMRERRG